MSSKLFRIEIIQQRFNELYSSYKVRYEEEIADEGEIADGWLHIKRFLPQKLDISDIEYNENFIKVIDYIEKERESLINEGKIPEKAHIFFAPVSHGIEYVSIDFNIGKFLIFLERSGIVEDLHLPMFIREKENKKVVEVKYPVRFTAEGAIKEALQSPEKFRNKIPRLKIKDWKGFLRVKEQFQKSQKQKKEIISQKSDEQSELVAHLILDKYKVSVKDREIWVNKYLIGKPHAVGSNFEFFEYIRSKEPNTRISREALPNFGGSLTLKEQVKSKSFIKIVNELGFKGEILKAFFYKRSKDTLTYRGDQVTEEDLEKAGVKKSLFLKELELAHARNSPE